MRNPYAVADMDGVPKTQYPQLAWQGVLALIARAEQAMDRGDVPSRHQALMHAQQLVALLDQGFQDHRAPELAQSVHRTYHSVLNFLALANLKNSRSDLEEARKLAIICRETWALAVQRAQRGGG